MIRRIVVGIDGSPGSQAALRWALAEARLRGATLHAVHAWELPLTPGGAGPYVVLGRPPEDSPKLDEIELAVQQEAERVLDEALGEVEGEVGDVEIERDVVQEAAPQALLRASAGAEMLVVGSRGRGGFAGLLLGSVSQQCAHHATCPVVVVRPGGGNS